jgi:hypothetical protein
VSPLIRGSLMRHKCIHTCRLGIADCPGKGNPAICSQVVRGNTKVAKWARENPGSIPQVNLPQRRQIEPPPPPVIRFPNSPSISPQTFITSTRLIADTLSLLLPLLPPDITTIVGASRSGLIPASLLASHLHLPMYSFSESKGVTELGGGYRMLGYSERKRGKVLFVDDTSATGRQTSLALPVLKEFFKGREVLTSVVYATSKGAEYQNYIGAYYEGLHYLEWNWNNAGHGAKCGYDFDGILCPNGKPSLPLFLPRRTTIPLVCSGRGEGLRGECEAWLKKWGVRYGRLTLRPDTLPDDWETIAEYKAGHYRESECTLFAESEPNQAERIAELSGKAVLCPVAERVYLPPSKPTSPPPKPLRDEARGLPYNPARGAEVRACLYRDCVKCDKAKCLAMGGKIVRLRECMACSIHDD